MFVYARVDTGLLIMLAAAVIKADEWCRTETFRKRTGLRWCNRLSVDIVLDMNTWKLNRQFIFSHQQLLQIFKHTKYCHDSNFHFDVFISVSGNPMQNHKLHMALSRVEALSNPPLCRPEKALLLTLNCSNLDGQWVRNHLLDCLVTATSSEGCFTRYDRSARYSSHLPLLSCRNWGAVSGC